MIIAIIPARGGSKRIPRKNIRAFAGRPMIAHAIQAAKACGIFERIVVSTDDEEIRHIAAEHGAEVPFARPAELANDHATTAPVIRHAILACEALGWDIAWACCMYPAVPFIRTEDIAAGLELLRRSSADFCYPVTAFPSAIQRALRRLPDGRLSFFQPEHELTRTQDLEPAYHDAGQFYWGSRKAWIENPRMHSSGVGLPIPHWRVVDIDTPEDWERAELLHKALQGDGSGATGARHI